jgi:nucleotide-binding universal stress UspA family protein
MYKTVVIPVDLAHRERVSSMLAAARTLADKGARMILVNVVSELPTFVAAELPADFRESAVVAAKAELANVAKSSGGKLETVVRYGSPASAILEHAGEVSADLVVIASHKPGWQDYLLGSTAARVVRSAKCSVLVVR